MYLRVPSPLISRDPPCIVRHTALSLRNTPQTVARGVPTMRLCCKLLFKKPAAFCKVSRTYGWPRTLASVLQWRIGGRASTYTDKSPMTVQEVCRGGPRSPSARFVQCSNLLFALVSRIYAMCPAAATVPSCCCLAVPRCDLPDDRGTQEGWTGMEGRLPRRLSVIIMLRLGPYPLLHFLAPPC